jgi:hypothetical protein
MLTVCCHCTWQSQFRMGLYIYCIPKVKKWVVWSQNTVPRLWPNPLRILLTLTNRTFIIVWSRRTIQKYWVRMWNGFGWLKTESSRGLCWAQSWILGVP